MVQLVATLKIITTYSGTYGGLSFAAGKFILVQFDDSTETTYAELAVQSGSSLIVTNTPLTSGPSLYYDSTGSFQSQAFIGFKYCSGTTLKYAQLTGVLPYVVISQQLNSTLCKPTPVGDLKFISASTVVGKATDLTTADGNFKVQATSSNGPVKYSLDPNFNYATQGQLSGVFYGLLPGAYTVYGKDSIGSQNSINVVVAAKSNYGVKWRIQYQDLSKIISRIDILERDFAGTLEYITAGPEPIVIEYRGDENDLYKTVIPSNAQIQLMTESGSEFQDQFQEIFTTDDRKYLVKFYKDDGTPNLPIPVPALDSLTLPIEPTLGTLSTFVNDTFSTGSNWILDTGIQTWVSGGNDKTSKYSEGAFIAKAGINYGFHYDYKFTDFNVPGSQTYLGKFQVVLLDAFNVVVALYEKPYNVIVSGSPHFTGDITLNPSSDCVKVGFRFIQTSSTQNYFNVYELSYTGWDATTIRATADLVFIPGTEYSFNYNITSSNAAGVIKISPCDDAYTDLLPPLTLTGIAGHYIGNYDFFAPAGATKIKITVSNAVLYDFDIVSFLRIPISVSEDTFALKWTGYVIPEYYSSPYLSRPYVVTITATDGLGEIGNYDFVDTSLNDFQGNMPVLKAINEILITTGLEINLRSTVNLYDAAMNQDDNDEPLTQAYIDPIIFYSDKDVPQKMDIVLDALLAPFGARLFQSLGVWWITRIEYSVSTSLVYREYDQQLNLIANEVFAPIINIKSPTLSNRFTWTDKSQNLSFLRDYGKINITHDLNSDDNLLDEGRFEAQDLVPSATGQFFKRWNFLIGQTGITYGLQGVKNEDSKGAFYCDYAEVTNAQNYSILYSDAVPITLKTNEKVKVSFDLSMIPYFNEIDYLEYAWRLRMTDTASGNYYDFTKQGDDYTINSETINIAYCTSFDEFTNVDLGLFGFAASNLKGTIQLSFYFHDHAYRNHPSVSSLKGETTIGVLAGLRKYVVGPQVTDDFGVRNITYSYTLNVDTSSESIPSIVRPNDYNSSTNPRQWILSRTFVTRNENALTKRILIDNAKILFYFYQQQTLFDPPKTVKYSKNSNPLVRSNLDKVVVLGDVPDIDNAPEIYRGYLRLSNGVPTTTWRRKGVAEAKTILQILLDDYYTQLNIPARKLRSSGYSDIGVAYINTLVDRDSNRYVHTRFSISDRTNRYDVNLVNIKTGDGGEPPVDLSQFSLAFSTDFNA